MPWYQEAMKDVARCEKPWNSTPDDVPKYSVCAMIKNTDTHLIRLVDEGVQAAIQDGVDKGKIPKSKIPILKLPLRDGTEEFKAGKKGPEFENMMFFNANNVDPPGIQKFQGKERVPVLDESEFYSGCWGYIDVNFFAFNKKSVGIGASLNNLLKVGDDTRLDGRQTADQAFADIEAPDLPDIPEEDQEMQ